MRMRLFFVIWMLVGFGGLAAAQDSLVGSLSRRQNSVTKVMRKAGCDDGWLAQIIADSGIKPGKLRQLPVGQKLYLKGASCKSTPPEGVANLSSMIIAIGSQVDHSAELKRQGEEIARLREANAKATRRLQMVTSENDTLKARILNFEERLAEAKEKLKATETLVSKTVNPIIPGLLGLALGAGLAFYATLWAGGRRKISFRRNWTVKSLNKSYEFTLFGAGESVQGSGVIVGRYKCPLCNEHNILGNKRNLLGHIATAHVYERMVTEIDPSFNRTPDATVRRERATQ